MDLIAGKKCYYRGRRVPEGMRFEAQRHHGRALIATKRATPAPGEKGGDYAHRAIRETPRRVDMHADEAPQGDMLSPFAAFDHDGDGRPGGSTAPDPGDELKSLRARYAEVVGRRAFAGWDADQLMAKINAAIEDGGLAPGAGLALSDAPADDGDA